MEQRSKTIVMLCQLMEEGEESSTCYWTTGDEPVTYGTVSVHLLSVAVEDSMIVRKFNIKEGPVRNFIVLTLV